jgi:signal transduction histidine kinase
VRRERQLTVQYVAALAWVLFTVALTTWWLIFGLSQARQLSALEGPDAAGLGRVTRMLVLEGTMLVVMLVSGGAALLVAIRREQRRRRDLSAFYMAFTHDLKTTLASLRLQAEALREDLPDAAASPNLQRLLKDAVRLELQLENALHLAHTDGQIFVETLDLGAVVDQLRHDWPELTIAVEGAVRVRADRRALESVLRNLLQNAVVHGRARNVTVAAAARPDGRVEMVVRDDGIGADTLTATALDRPFVRPSATSGSGVGLYICRRLLTQMHGQIDLVAGQPSGFAVRIALPGAA